jgi:hypothetical protein
MFVTYKMDPYNSIVAIMLLIVCAIAISYHNRLSDMNNCKCGTNNDESCSSGTEFGFVVTLIGIIIASLYLSYDIYDFVKTRYY